MFFQVGLKSVSRVLKSAKKIIRLKLQNLHLYMLGNCFFVTSIFFNLLFSKKNSQNFDKGQTVLIENTLNIIRSREECYTSIN